MRIELYLGDKVEVDTKAVHVGAAIEAVRGHRRKTGKGNAYGTLGV